MKAGRKNLRRARDEGAAVTLAEGECIMQVLALRGSNVIEVMDGKGVKSLALFPAKFQKSFWIKKGEYSKIHRDLMRLEIQLETSSRSQMILPLLCCVIAFALNVQGVSWSWMLVGGIRLWNQAARLRVLCRRSSSTTKFVLWRNLMTGHLSSSQLPMKAQMQERREKLHKFRLMRKQILMTMMIYHRLKQTQIEIDRLNCILIQTVALILEVVYLAIAVVMSGRKYQGNPVSVPKTTHVWVTSICIRLYFMLNSGHGKVFSKNCMLRQDISRSLCLNLERAIFIPEMVLLAGKETVLPSCFPAN